MNFKFLFPTFLNRVLFVEKSLSTYTKERYGDILHIGCGEGDYDPVISKFCKQLVSCDHNEDDLSFARERNKRISNLEYKIEDALSLSFEDNTFDRVIAVEVLEHVNNPKVMLENIYRVLKPNGITILTFPSLEFPFTYDPLNRVISWFSSRHLPIGAYAFGHDRLISSRDFKIWASECEFTILHEEPLSGYLVGLLELYWTGIVQHVFKKNASNKSKNRRSGLLASRPGNKIPYVARLSRKIADLDSHFFKIPNHSIGKGFVLQKK